MAAVSSANAEKFIEASKSGESSPSRRISDAASEASSSSAALVSGTPDHSDQPNSSLNSPKDIESQNLAALRSEEYRQLFRLPADEVLIQDFNCAFQESILLQGHMYVFLHCICFYSNIFGFETKKIIPFDEVTCVRRAKTAGIFPNAIEITAGGRKYFFASFLSRDEAFKLINDGWLQYGNDAKAFAEQQESMSETCSQENGVVAIENLESSESPPNEFDSVERSYQKKIKNEFDSVERNEDAPTLDDPKLPSIVEDEIVLRTLPEGKDNAEEEAQALISESLVSGKTLLWKEDNSDAPKLPEYYTKVAEAKFPIKVEQFFSLFFSDESVDFVDSFHKRCGDKDLKCSPWYPHDKFGHARDVSFQHPIKLYFGAKFGSCQEIQKFRVYRNSHLVIETSQEISDVPYGDYFRVEGLWDVEGDGDESKECCYLQVYVHVAFSKRTVWKGKIVQSTVEECREAYTTWISIVHELLKQKNLEKQEEEFSAASLIQNNQLQVEKKAENGTPSERSLKANDRVRNQQVSDSKDVKQQTDHHLEGNLIYTTPVASSFKESVVKICANLKSQSHLPVLLVIFAAILLLMQLSIVVLLARPPQVQVISQADYISGMRGGLGERSSEALGWLEKRVHYLKEEMYAVESRLEKMRLDHRLLKVQLEDLEQIMKKRT